MNQAKQNKEFIIEYFNAMAGAAKTFDIAAWRRMAEKYISDEKLIEHGMFFSSVFPGYDVLTDEIIAEGNRVVVRARLKGKHEGEFNGIPPTHKEVEFPFVIGYEIENNKIISHWLLADQMRLMEQLGVMSQPV